MRISLADFVWGRCVHHYAVVKDFYAMLVRTTNLPATERVQTQWNVWNNIPAEMIKRFESTPIRMYSNYATLIFKHKADTRPIVAKCYNLFF